MVENLNYLVAPMLLALFGLPAGFAPGIRRASLSVRFAMSFMTGTVAVVVWGTILSTLGVKWLVSTVVVPMGLMSLIAAGVVARRSAGEPKASRWCRWDAMAAVVSGGAIAHLALMAGTSRSTSIDFFYFWGVKAVRFAEAGGFDAEYLASPFAVHSHVPYPPLVTLVSVWGVDLVGRLPWRAGLVSMAMWMMLAYPIVLRSLRSRLPEGDATIASGVWMLGVSLAMASSFSAGGAEPALVFFTTIALVSLVASDGTFPTWVAPVAACGMVLTKAEGIVLWVLLTAGLAVRDVVERRSLGELVRRLSGIVMVPPFALMPWIAFLIRNDLPLSDAARESVGRISFENLVPALSESLRNLEAGSGWIAWGIAILVLVLSRRGLRTALPALAVMLGVLGFMLVYYLHYQGDSLGDWVRWTLPRVSLTALSAALIAAAVASGERELPGAEEWSRKKNGSPFGDP